MKPYMIKILLVILGIILVTILLGPRLFYRPLSSKAELVFLNAVEVDTETVDYETLGAKASLTYIETPQGNQISLEIFDDTFFNALYQDLSDFIEVMEEIKYRLPWDIMIVESESNLEITFHARFENAFFYTTKKIIVSKAMNLILPFEGGVTIRDLAPFIGYPYLQGFMAQRIDSVAVSHDQPFIVTLAQSKDVTITEDGNFKGRHVLFYPNRTLDYDDANSTTTTYAIN